MCVVLSFALAGQLMQMAAAARSIPRIFESLPQGLLLEDLSQSRKGWVRL